MSNNKLLLVMTVLLIFAAMSLQNQIRTTGKAAFELAGTFQAVDEPPKLRQALPNNSVKPSENTTTIMNLSVYFKEPNAENITYSYAASSAVNISLDNATGIMNLTMQSEWRGRAEVNITAYDSSNNNLTSNTIAIIVREVNITKSTFDSVTGIGWYESQSSGKLDINSLADGELENLTEIIIEKEDYGKILFAEPINISQDTNLDANINISDNHIGINSSALPNFDKPATLQFYNLTFTDPRILKDGVVCPATECVEINYSSSSGILIFNVTGFTAYSAEESPAQPAEETVSVTGKGGGGSTTKGRAAGGTGGLIEKPTAFEVDTTGIKADVRQNRLKTEVIKISNPTDSEMNIDISAAKDVGFIYTEKSISLAPGETKDIELKIAPTDENPPDTYATQIVLKESNSEKIIRLMINVQSALQLLDMEMDIYSGDLTVAPGENLLAGLRLFNLGESKRMEVKVEWYIKDFNNGVLLKESTMVDVETQLAYMKKIFIPSTMDPGSYVLVAIATYEDSTAVASSMFNVEAKPIFEKPLAPEKGLFILLICVIAALVLLIIMLLIIIKYEKMEMEGLVVEERRVLNQIGERLRRRR
ncbi:hypothetical protein COV19_02815 [Candidatus Woesearchaeota archaeon CG10_big_fil_rev_8_21_14_0_10_44_13]|nr:MAG: hypothetical protein COV19_02815 [Candidatus Woesearchaeota archaeon CG10_big_fil_rev_8_21_14_0_10_44_13]